APGLFHVCHPGKPLDNRPPVPGDYFRPPQPRRMRGMEKTALNSARQTISQLHGLLSAFAQGLDFGAGGISGATAATVVGGELGAAVGSDSRNRLALAGGCFSQQPFRRELARGGVSKPLGVMGLAGVLRARQ